MALSVFDLYSVGIGPSSSHTVGPMRAAAMFARQLDRPVARIKAELFGSLGATGHGHGSAKAVVLGLEGEDPATVDVDAADERVAGKRELRLPNGQTVPFDQDADLVLHRRRSLPEHPNGMIFRAWGPAGELVAERTYFSVGGGFVTGPDGIVPDSTELPHPFATGAELLRTCRATGLPVSGVMRVNERAWRTDAEVSAGLGELWDVMQACVERGCHREGVLPGGLRVPRRAPALYRDLKADAENPDPLRIMDWVNLFALAVNEENAAGGRIVTAPTNGAAGIIPAVLHYYTRFVPGASADGVERFLLTAAAIGILIKGGASISGAEVGCQGEVGSACAMAAAGLCEVLGGTPEQVENAAEIGLEHNLGLTCDPVGGLVQIPCIERNAIASVKAINAARLARNGTGEHKVTLDKAIKTMRETGRDMSTKYKETARGGLAVTVIEC
ncbi:L-serine ammonia-lyase [Dactylosporangium sucinum]|uniref:L-serine dehydratase n=1 Tax=Dactylosporangium sucinum TaxID=1424081 RepID=A0A917U4G6_9ACTN|nr:L-serine ammonia-lyase [Dactylosporangium sucinum]GGM57748.1 L-serine dehydratase [Dactylosporangium sucinum]